MLLSSQYLVQTVWFQLREWRKNGLEVLKLNISKGPVSRPPLSGSDCLNLVLDFGTTLPYRRFFFSRSLLLIVVHLEADMDERPGIRVLLIFSQENGVDIALRHCLQQGIFTVPPIRGVSRKAGKPLLPGMAGLGKGCIRLVHGQPGGLLHHILRLPAGTAHNGHSVL